MCAHFRFATVCLAVVAMAVSAHAATYSIGAEFGSYEPTETYDATNPTGDGIGDAANFGVSGALRIGSRTVASSGLGTAVSTALVFALPAIPTGETISGATLSILTKNQTTNLPVANADLYGLPFDVAPMDQDPTRYFSGASDSAAGVTKLQDNFLAPADASAPDTRITSLDIGSYVQSLYDAGAVAGDFAVLRLSYDQAPELIAHNRYLVWQKRATATTENGTDKWPYLEITTVPEPASLSLLLLGVSGLVARRRR